MIQWRLRFAAFLVGILAGLVLPPSPASATNYNMYNWMQPPSDVSGGKACLTQRWHGAYDGDEVDGALDWKGTCGSMTAGTIFYRSRDAAPDDSYVLFVGARGTPEQRPSFSCETGSLIHYAYVRIRTSFTGVLKGVETYQHATVTVTSTFDITFQGGASFTGAHYNSIAIGVEERDPGCSSGYHVHENNHDTAYWDLLQKDYYKTAPLEPLECCLNNVKETWTRRLHWIDVF
jgi:hypothetical protein